MQKKFNLTLILKSILIALILLIIIFLIFNSTQQSASVLAINNFISKNMALVGMFFVLILFISFLGIKSQGEAEDKYKYFFDYYEDAVITLCQPDWKFSDYNPAALKLFGIKDVATMKTLTLADMSPPTQHDGRDSKEKLKEMIQSALDNNRTIFYWTYKKIDGGEFWASVSLTKMKIKNQIILQALVRDITDQYNALEQVKKSEKESEKALQEAERLNKLMIGRELKMVDLKKEIEELKAKK